MHGISIEWRNNYLMLLILIARPIKIYLQTFLQENSIFELETQNVAAQFK